MVELILAIEGFMADGGEPSEARIILNGKPVYGLFTLDELRAAYPDDDNLRPILQSGMFAIDATARPQGAMRVIAGGD